MSRSVRGYSIYSRAPLPRGIPQQLRSTLSQVQQPETRGIEMRPRVAAGRRIKSPSAESPRHVHPLRGRPAPPVWLSFTGGGGAFRFVLDVPKTSRRYVRVDEQELLWEVQLASDSLYTTSVTSYNVSPSDAIYLPELTRFARARYRYFDSEFSAWAVSGSPTSQASGTAGAGVSQPDPPPSDPPPGGGGGGTGYLK